MWGSSGPASPGNASNARLLDEIVVHVAPVLLGRGVRLFGDERVELERVSGGAAEGLTDLRFRVLKERQQ
jgi:riboflavin biosynthesis pyrimidine reductase